ncbi:hypothetical protein [Streptomyces griseoruber]|uniref:hypothetical protein n=1 Tax=Streptomyces griseoruber TaxID=1943 RepID=UPI000AD7730E
MTKALVDQGFKKKVVEHGKNVGIDVENVERNPDDKGFVPQAKRWIVEQTNGILMFYRRLVRAYEHRPASSRSRVFWAMTSVVSRRLTGATLASWRTSPARPSSLSRCPHPPPSRTTPTARTTPPTSTSSPP